MNNGIYIRPAVVRLVVLASVALFALFLKGELPQIRRYIKFETM